MRYGMPAIAGTTHRFAGGDLQDFGGQTHGAFDAKLLVLGSVDEIGRNWGKCL